MPVALAPTLLGAVGWLYGTVALALSLGFIAHAVIVWRAADDVAATRARGACSSSRSSISRCCSRRCRSTACLAGWSGDERRDRRHRRPRDSDRHRRQRSKNIFMFFCLLAMAAVFFALTVVRMGGGSMTGKL